MLSDWELKCSMKTLNDFGVFSRCKMETVKEELRNSKSDSEHDRIMKKYISMIIGK